MKNNLSYLLILVLLFSCSKNSTETKLSGNWAFRTYLYVVGDTVINKTNYSTLGNHIQIFYVLQYPAGYNSVFVNFNSQTFTTNLYLQIPQANQYTDQYSIVDDSTLSIRPDSSRFLKNSYLASVSYPFPNGNKLFYSMPTTDSLVLYQYWSKTVFVGPGLPFTTSYFLYLMTLKRN